MPNGIREIEEGSVFYPDISNCDDILRYGVSPFMADELGGATGYDVTSSLDNDHVRSGVLGDNSVIHEALREIYAAHKLETIDQRGWSYDADKIAGALAESSLPHTAENIEKVIELLFPGQPDEVTLSMVAFLAIDVRNYPSHSGVHG